MDKADYTVLASTNLPFSTWEKLVEELRRVGISTVSRATFTCQNCGADAPPLWQIYIREEDKDLLE